jgi:hypothetical protein
VSFALSDWRTLPRLLLLLLLLLFLLYRILSVFYLPPRNLPFPVEIGKLTFRILPSVDVTVVLLSSFNISTCE